MYRTLFASGPAASFLAGAAISIILTGIVCLILVGIASSIGGYWLGIPGFIISLLFGWAFFQKGFWNIPNKHLGLIEVLERRMPDPILGEGYVWVVPSLMKVTFWDAREKSINVQVAEILSSEDVPITIDTFFTLETVDPFRRENIEDPEQTLEWVVERIIRIFSNGKKTLDIVRCKQKLSQAIQYGYNTETGEPLTQQEAHENFERALELNSVSELQNEMGADGTCPTKIVIGADTFAEAWGCNIPRLFVQNIRLPKAIEDAATQILVEAKERESELENAKTWAKIAEEIKGKLPDLTDAEINSTIKIMQGQATETIHTIQGIDSDALGIVAAGLLAAKDLKGKGNA